MKDTGILTIDFGKFTKRIDFLVGVAAPKTVGAALRELAKQLIYDAINQEPTVPKGQHRRNIGKTTRSGKVGKRVGIGGELRASAKYEMDGDYAILVGFNMPYAAYQEKGQRKDGSYKVKNYSEAGSGKEFVGKKLKQNKDVYNKKLAEDLEQNLK